MTKRQLSRDKLERFESIDVDVFMSLDVLIWGIGRFGMTTLDQLLAYPIRKVTGVDFDRVSGRESGSLFPMGYEDEYKVRVAKERVDFWFRNAEESERMEFEPVIMKLDEDSLPRFSELMDKHDYLFCAADDWRMLEQVCKVAHHRIPMTGAALAEGGNYVEVAWSVPGQGQTLAQTLQADKRIQALGESTLPVDVNSAANLAVRIMLGIVLAGRRGFDRFRHLLDPNHQLIVVHCGPNDFVKPTNQLVPMLTRLVSNESA